MGWVSLALLALAVVVLVGAEWPRLEGRFGVDARRRRDRSRRKANLRVVRPPAADDDPEQLLQEFAASVERDLQQLPTIEENDRGR